VWTCRLGLNSINYVKVASKYKMFCLNKCDLKFGVNSNSIDSTREKTYSESDIVSRIVDRHNKAVEIVRDDVNLHQLVAFRRCIIHDWQYNLNCWYSVGR